MTHQPKTPGRYGSTFCQDDGNTSRIELADYRRSARLAELRVAYKSRTKPAARFRISGPADAVPYLRSIWNARTIEFVEDLVVLYLNSAHEVLGWVKVATGGRTSSPLDQRVIYAIALQTASCAIILAHNHPAGSTEPSPADRAVTTRLRQAGELLDIKLLDHIIITPQDAFSFQEQGLL